MIRELKDDLAAGLVVTITGTGVSVAARSKRGVIDGIDVATWTGLLQHGVNHCADMGIVNDKMSRALRELIDCCETDCLISAADLITKRLQSKSEGVFGRWLKNTVGRLSPSKHGRALLKAVAALPGPLATLNYDSLFEIVTRWPAVTWLKPDAVEGVLRGKITKAVLHLHGWFEEPESVVFGTSSYDAVKGDAHAREVLKVFAIRQTILFIGCGNTVLDPNFTGLIDWAADGLRRVSPRHYLLCRTSELDDFRDKLQRAPWLQLLDYGSEYEHLGPFVARLARPKKTPQVSRRKNRFQKTTCGRCFVPRPVDDFIEPPQFVRIKESLRPENRSWGALIFGPPGVGKTQIALHAATQAWDLDRSQTVTYYSAKEWAFDGSVHKVKRTLTGFHDVLADVARDLGSDRIPRLGIGARRAALLRLLQETNALLLFDNIETLSDGDRRDLFGFVNQLHGDGNRGSKAILTMRSSAEPTASGGTLIELRGDVALAEKLLDRIASTNSFLQRSTKLDRLQLCKAVGGNLLALRWAVGLLGKGQWVSVQKATKLLTRSRTNTELLEYLFGHLLQDLEALDREILFALTLFALPVGADVIAHMVDSSRKEVGARLLKLNAIAFAEGVGDATDLREFELVPLVGQWIPIKTSKAIARKIEDRVVARVAHLAKENGRREQGEVPQFAILERHWPLVEACLRLFRRRDFAQFQQVCSDLMLFLTFAGHWDERLRLAALAEKRARSVSPEIAGMRAFQAGYIYSLRGAWKDVFDCAERAEMYWKRAGSDSFNLSMLHYLRGRGDRIAGNDLAAIGSFKTAIRLLPRTRANENQFVENLTELGKTELSAGRLPLAERRFRESLRIAARQKPQFIEGIARAKTALAEVALKRRQWSAALKAAEEALPLSEDMKCKPLMATNLLIIGEGLLALKRAPEAKSKIEQATEICEGMRSTDLDRAKRLFRRIKRSFH